MPLSLSQTATAVTANIPASFLATGGTSPYVYSVVAGGAGGSINSATGVYTAPATLNSDPSKSIDIIQVTDSLSATATAKILVGTPLLLLCDIIQSEMGLADGRVYLWDQKLKEPTDFNLYIAVSMVRCQPFANIRQTSTSGTLADQSLCMLATVDIDLISRGPDARDRKEELILALASVYAEQQQNANSFFVGRIPHAGGFINLSNIDGAAIPYRYKITVTMQYSFAKLKSVPYFDTFTETVTTD